MTSPPARSACHARGTYERRRLVQREWCMPAKRAYGIDQEFYPWSPIVTRPVLRWPDNARVALAVIVNLEHWDWEVPDGMPVAASPMGGPEGLWSGNQPQFGFVTLTSVRAGRGVGFQSSC